MFNQYASLGEFVFVSKYSISQLDARNFATHRTISMTHLKSHSRQPKIKFNSKFKPKFKCLSTHNIPNLFILTNNLVFRVIYVIFMNKMVIIWPWFSWFFSKTPDALFINISKHQDWKWFYSLFIVIHITIDWLKVRRVEWSWLTVSSW